KRFCSISFNIGRLLISFLMRTPPFLFSGEKLLYQRRESSSYFLEIEGIFQLCPRKYFTHTRCHLKHISFDNRYKKNKVLTAHHSGKGNRHGNYRARRHDV